MREVRLIVNNACLKDGLELMNASNEIGKRVERNAKDTLLVKKRAVQ